MPTSPDSAPWDIRWRNGKTGHDHVTFVIVMFASNVSPLSGVRLDHVKPWHLLHHYQYHILSRGGVKIERSWDLWMTTFCVPRFQGPGAVWLISRHWNWGILSIKTARPPAVKEQTVKVSQFLRACKVQTVILWISAIGNFNIIRSQRACKEQTTIQWISAIGNLNRYVDIMGCCPCVRWGELCVCV